MSGKILFGVIVRTVGLLLAIYGLSLLIAALSTAFVRIPIAEASGLLVLSGILYGAAGWLLLAKADIVVRLAYRGDLE